METTSIQKPKWGMTPIKGTEITSTICVPTQMQEYEELGQTLEEINPLTTTSTSRFLKKYCLAPMALSLEIIAAVAVFKSHNKLQVTIGWLTLCAILILSIYEGRKNKSIYFRTNKGLGWIAIVFFQFWLVLFLLLHVLINSLLK